MSIALVSSAGFVSGYSPQTTGAIDTTGATLLVPACGSYQTNAGTWSDSKGNTFSVLFSPSGSADDDNVILGYSVGSPTVGSGHTFTDVSCIYTFDSALAFSGVAAFDTYTRNANKTGSGPSSIQPGSITPAQADEVFIVIAYQIYGSVALAIDSGFTVAYRIDGSPGGSSLIFAYLIASGSSSVNPTITIDTTGHVAVLMAAFTPSSGGGGSKYPGYQAPFGWHRNKEFSSSFKEKLFREQVKNAPILNCAA